MEIGVNPRPQERIAEETGRDGLQVAEPLLAHRVGRLLEEEELELRRRRDREAQSLRPVEDAAQRAARAGRLRIAGELAEKEGQVVLEGNEPHGLRENAHGGVRIGGVPAGERRVVVELVVRIPAEHDVAKAEALFERRLRTCRGPCISRA